MLLHVLNDTKCYHQFYPKIMILLGMVQDIQRTHFWYYFFTFAELSYLFFIHVFMNNIRKHSRACFWPTLIMVSPSSPPPALTGTRLGRAEPLQLIFSQVFQDWFSYSGAGRVFHGSSHTEVFASASQAHLVISFCPCKIKSYNNTITKFANECKLLKCFFKQVIISLFFRVPVIPDFCLFCIHESWK